MTVQNGKNSARSDHRRHDRLLVTRFAVDDSYPGEADQAQQLIAACVDCAELAADVRVIAASMKELPAPARPRDFAISQEQADRLRGSRLARLARSLATPGWATLRPVAGVALSIGLVMAVVGSVLPNYGPAATTEGGGASERSQTFGAQRGGEPATQHPQPAAAASLPAAPVSSLAPALEAPGGMEPDAAEAPGGESVAEPTQDAREHNLDTAYIQEASPEAAIGVEDGDSRPALIQAAPADPTRNLLIYAGLAIAIISFALLVLAWSARRYFADPLLR